MYLDLLARWNSTVNLSSARTSDEAGFRSHIEDSLNLVAHLPTGLTRLVDLGSGQGFPAIPIAIATGINIEMIEADRRKAAFLTTALASLHLDGRVTRDRIERATVVNTSCVTAKALAPLPRLIQMAQRFLLPGGCCLFLKGPAALAEAAHAQRGTALEITIIPTRSPRSNLVKVTGFH